MVSRLVSLLNDDVAVAMFLVHCLKMLNTLFSGSSVECCDEDLIFTVVLDVIKVCFKYCTKVREQIKYPAVSF